MDISDVVIAIVDRSDPVERVICLTEVIVHLQIIKSTYTLHVDYTGWKEQVNNAFIKDVHKIFDKQINELKELITHDVKI